MLTNFNISIILLCMTNFIPQKPELKPDAKKACIEISKITKAPCFVFIINEVPAMIDENIYMAICQNKDKLNKGKLLNIIMFSYGGNIHSAYKIMKILRNRFESIHVYVVNQAKSAATFMCLGGDEIILAEWSELGPLDSQHKSPADPQRVISALESFKALESIRKFTLETFDSTMLHFLARSGLTMIEAIPHVTNLVGKIVEPLFNNFDVHRLGDYVRSLEIAQDYGTRIMAGSYKSKNDVDRHLILFSLIWNYPSHGQVIDFDECIKLGLNARLTNDDEEKILQEIKKSVDNTLYVGIITEEDENEKTSGTP